VEGVAGRSTSLLVVVGSPVGIEGSILRLLAGIGVGGRSILGPGSLEEGIACMGLEMGWAVGRDRRLGGRVVGRKVVGSPVLES
jgi:hypothetical protein